jgi:uncharacterized protein YndB with AHSA1/START domain
MRIGRCLRASVEIDAPADKVWQLLTEFRFWPQWGPTVRRVETKSAEVAPGVTGRVQTVVGIWLPFEITDVEPMRSWDWRVAGIKATGHEVSPISPERTWVQFTVSAYVGPYVAVLRRGLRRLKALAETGHSQA